MPRRVKYKCPACGGSLKFDPSTQKLKCPYCDSVYDLDQFEVKRGDEADSAEQKDDTQDASSSEGTSEAKWDVSPGSEWQEGEEEKMSVFSCGSCGGEIIADSSTVSLNCPYCGSPVILKGRVSGMLKPDCVIPFKLDRKQAKEALRNHVNSKKLVPELFKEENHIDEIKGVYVPFWLFSTSADADISYKGTRTIAWSDSKYDYIETNFFRIRRQGSIAFDNVPVDGSEMMPDDLMESIEPFDYSEAVDFKTAYLSGYMADKYDVDADDSVETANARIRRSTEEAFGETVEGFETVTPERTDISLRDGDAKYALYPVWLLNTKWQDSTYTFAMNGQTGRFVGDLPLDKAAYRKGLLTLALICSVISTVAVTLIDYFLL